MRRLHLRLCAVLLLAGCAARGPRLLQPGRVRIADAYTVDSTTPWTAVKGVNGEFWTVDGPILDGLQFVNGIAEGEGLLTRGAEAKMPRFKRTMATGEMVEFLVDSLSATDLTKVQAKNVKAAKFGGADGFRFDLECLSPQGLERQGIVVGAVLNDKLYVILYSAARRHYFAAYREAVEKVIESIQVE